MSDEAAEGRSNLARARRFLLVMSVIVVAYYGLRARFLGEVTYSGFGLHVDRPDLVPWGLWAVWIWALVGYLQRFIKLSDVVRQSIEIDVDVEDNRLALRAARRRAREVQDAAEVTERFTEVRVDPKSIGFAKVDYERLRLRSGVLVKTKVPYMETQHEGRQYALNGAFSGVAGEGRGPGGGTFNFIMDWDPGRTRRHRLKSWVAALCRRPGLVEHVAPFFLAAFVVLSPFVFPRPTAGPTSECLRPCAIQLECGQIAATCEIATSNNESRVTP